MAQNTFLQNIMSNAQPKPVWEQPSPTQAPPTMAGPAAPTPSQMQSMVPAAPTNVAPAAPYKYGDPAPYPVAEGQDFFGLNAGAVPLANPDGSFQSVMPTKTEEDSARQEPALNLFGQILATPGQMSKNADEFFGSAMRYFTPKEELGYTPPTGGDVLATAGIRAPGGDIHGSPGRTEAITKPQDRPTMMPTQQAPVAGTTAAPEPAPQTAVQLDPMSDEAILARRAQGQGTSSPQQNFQLRVSNGEPLNQEEIAQAEALAKHMGTTFDPVTGYSRQPFLDAQSTPQQGVQQGAGLTTVGGAPLNEFLGGAAMPEQGFARAENAMYGDNSLSRGLGGDAATKAFQDASDAREARLGFDNRPGVDVPSLAMQRSRMDAGLDPVEGAPTGTDMSQQQQRDALERGFDPATGQPIKNKEGLTFEQAMAERRQRLAENKFDYERVNDFNAATKEEAAAISKAQDAQSRDAMTGKGMKRSVLDMLDVMDNVGGRLDKFMSTDMTGKVLSFWKGSEADAQEADFAFLQSNVALKAMMELKAQSSTGATGFGALNTKELEVLTNRFATLDPFTKPDIIRENLVRLRDQTKAMFEDAKIRHAEQYGPEAAEAVYGDLIRSTGGAKGASQQSSVPNDQNVAGKADHLFSSGKY